MLSVNHTLCSHISTLNHLEFKYSILNQPLSALIGATSLNITLTSCSFSCSTFCVQTYAIARYLGYIFLFHMIAYRDRASLQNYRDRLCFTPHMLRAVEERVCGGVQSSYFCFTDPGADSLLAQSLEENDTSCLHPQKAVLPDKESLSQVLTWLTFPCTEHFTIYNALILSQSRDVLLSSFCRGGNKWRKIEITWPHGHAASVS